jgi:hypothetical protein
MLFETKSALGVHATIRRGPAHSPARGGGWMRLLSQVMILADAKGQLVRHAERPWASATFSGARHAIALSFTGPAAIEAGERMIADLADHEFDLPGFFVADATVSSVNHALLPEPALTIELEILLLEDL